ncbi:MAG TPA: helix-turn-helix domain-containing protein [Solirubrobacteraceae bacterium]|nr:helix-turn-helix domain-containing protein [Solirubrobacteraceae bacterium]
MAKGELLRDRTAAAIIDSAASLLAQRGPAASMEEIASGAGIGRATLYRYFPNREELLRAMAAASVQELAARIEEANLEGVAVEEAIARLARAIIATGSKYVALNGDSAKLARTYPDFELRVTEPVRALFHRAVADGSLREGWPADVLMDLFSGLITGALAATARGQRGVEESAAAVTTLFLDGARAA